MSRRDHHTPIGRRALLGKTTDKQAATDRKALLSTSRAATQVEQWAVNKAVRHNERAKFGKTDFKPVVAYKELLDRSRAATVVVALRHLSFARTDTPAFSTRWGTGRGLSCGMVAWLVRTVRLLIVLTSWHRALALENLALRQQLAMYRRTRPRPAVRWSDRLFWLALRRAWPEWTSALVVLRPATVTGWHRRGFACYWRRKSRARPGRPGIDAELRRLVPEMADANPLWGAPRIHGELLTLGCDVSERTVSRLMPSRRRPPSQTWRTFLQNHVGAIAALDFFSPTLTCRVLFVLVVLAHDRRRILHINATAHPTSEWTRQQLREAFPWDITARYLLHDRDTTFDVAFRQTVRELGLASVTAPRSPWQNPYVERVISSIRRECLDHVLVVNERHLRRVLRAYTAYYHRSRTHLALGKDAPDARPVQASGLGRIVAFPEVGGLHHRYERRAA